MTMLPVLRKKSHDSSGFNIISHLISMNIGVNMKILDTMGVI